MVTTKLKKTFEVTPLSKYILGNKRHFCKVTSAKSVSEAEGVQKLKINLGLQ